MLETITAKTVLKAEDFSTSLDQYLKQFGLERVMDDPDYYTTLLEHAPLFESWYSYNMINNIMSPYTIKIEPDELVGVVHLLPFFEQRYRELYTRVNKTCRADRSFLIETMETLPRSLANSLEEDLEDDCETILYSWEWLLRVLQELRNVLLYDLIDRATGTPLNRFRIVYLQIKADSLAIDIGKVYSKLAAELSHGEDDILFMV